MDTPSTFAGGCACRAVRYECSSAPVSMVNCHCRDCQRAGGAGHSPTVVLDIDHFRLVSGEPRYHELKAESGNVARRAFCVECGSPLFASSSGRPNFVGIRAGSLDDPSWFRPTVDVWTSSSQSWDALDTNTTKFPRSPT